ncbi:RES domain-containing protein [Aliarcobacter butzleri]|uniref:RES domain-containing protein n=1 Tax=Aliarcobacter butzleri TaxID=28197 RepID=UPI00263E3D09|nr:RES domain-containing protein [Aliarcobacter butzleri]MDN5049707.1 RES domain-containing protein [Aliarcobacter butzleri]MDN5056974.1 RES domain-containing protein [Aliarcobacter butzleri]
MNCCPNCFNDDFLTEQINSISKNIGDCDYCKTQKIEIINPNLLSDYFQPVIDLYEDSKDGLNLVELLKKDWILFFDLDIEISKKLIEDILETKFDNLFIPKSNMDVRNILNWQEFKDELKHINRYFPKKAPSYSHLNGLLQNLIMPVSKVPKYLFRARINENENSIPIEKMGKPPAKISTAGRANPIGIPYLYTASNPETAISEIRPHKGDKVTIATFEVIKSLKFADLRNPRQTISPFSLSEDGLNQLFLDLNYLCHLGEELSKPILPREAHLEYLSSQYLCELIKDCGFDGVVYKSSVGSGDNFAIFYDEKLIAINIKCYKIDNVNFDFSE